MAEAEPAEYAGILPRTVALLMDMFVGVAACLTPVLFLLLWFPADRVGESYLSIGFFILPAAGLTYLYFGCALLPNTLGRYAVGIRVRREQDGNRPTAGQAFVRTLFIGLWPAEIIAIAARPRKQRLGDRAAKTVVQRYAPARPRRQRLMDVLLAIAGFFLLIHASVPSIVGRTEIAGVARDHVMEVLAPDRVAEIHGVRVQDESGQVFLCLESGRCLCLMSARRAGKWQVLQVREISRADVYRGFRIKTRSMAISADT